MADPVVTALASGSSSTAVTTITHTAQAAGTILFLEYVGDDYYSTTGTTRPESSGYTLIQGIGAGSGSFHGNAAWYKVATGSETQVQYTIGSASRSAYKLSAFNGVDTTTPLDTSAKQNSNGSTNTYTTPTVTPSAGRRFAVGVLAASNGGSLLTAPGTPTNGYTNQGSGLSTSTPGLSTTMLTLALDGGTATSTGVTWTGTTPEARSAIIAVFRVPTGGSAFTGSVALSGSGTVASAGKPAAVASLGLTGAGNDAGAGKPAVNASMALTGSGQQSLSGATPTTVTATATVTANSVTTLAFTGTGSLVGTGQPKLTQELTATGSGTLGLSGTAFTSSTVATTGSGSLALTGVQNTGTAVSLSGSGALVVSGTASTAATLLTAGSGTLALFGSKPGAAAFAGTGSGSLTFSGKVAQSGSVALTGAGSLVLAGEGQDADSLELTGTGSLALSGKPAFTSAVVMAGDGTLTSTATQALSGALSLSGTGALVYLTARRDITVKARLLPRIHTAAITGRTNTATIQPRRWRAHEHVPS